MIPENFSTFNILSKKSNFDVLCKPWTLVTEFNNDGAINACKKVALLFYVYIFPVSFACKTGRFPWICVVSFTLSSAWVFLHYLGRADAVKSKQDQCYSLIGKFTKRVNGLIKTAKRFDDQREVVQELEQYKSADLNSLGLQVTEMNNSTFSFDARECKRQFSAIKKTFERLEKGISATESKINGLSTVMIAGDKDRLEGLKGRLQVHINEIGFLGDYLPDLRFITSEKSSLRAWCNAIAQAHKMEQKHANTDLKSVDCHTFKRDVRRLEGLIAKLDSLRTASFMEEISKVEKSQLNMLLMKFDKTKGDLDFIFICNGSYVVEEIRGELDMLFRKNDVQLIMKFHLLEIARTYNDLLEVFNRFQFAWCQKEIEKKWSPVSNNIRSLEKTIGEIGYLQGPNCSDEILKSWDEKLLKANQLVTDLQKSLKVGFNPKVSSKLIVKKFDVIIALVDALKKVDKLALIKAAKVERTLQVQALIKGYKELIENMGHVPGAYGLIQACTVELRKIEDYQSLVERPRGLMPNFPKFIKGMHDFKLQQITKITRLKTAEQSRRVAVQRRLQQQAQRQQQEQQRQLQAQLRLQEAQRVPAQRQLQQQEQRQQQEQAQRQLQAQLRQQQAQRVPAQRQLQQQEQRQQQEQAQRQLQAQLRQQQAQRAAQAQIAVQVHQQRPLLVASMSEARRQEKVGEAKRIWVTRAKGLMELYKKCNPTESNAEINLAVHSLMKFIRDIDLPRRGDIEAFLKGHEERIRILQR
jgi:hypothetical protein